MVVDEDVSIDVLDACVMEFDFYPEEGTEKTEEFISGDEVIQRFGFVHEDHEGPEKVNHYCVHDRVAIDGIQHSRLSRTQHSEKLRYEALGLGVVEDLRVVLLVEDELECRVIDKFLYLLDQGFGVGVIYFKAELQVLVVEDTDMSLGIILEDLDNTIGVNQVLVEEGREISRSPESVLRSMKIVQRPHVYLIYI